VAIPADNRCTAHAVVHDRRFSTVQCDHEAGHVELHAAARRDEDTAARWQWSDAESLPTWVPQARTVEPSLVRKLLKRVLG
jgi:hypothetical protein